MEKFPSAKDLVEEAKKSCNADLNALHRETYALMIKHRQQYYRKKVDEFLKTTSLKGAQLSEVRAKMLRPIRVGSLVYSNFMEEASRRISQVFQVISGNIAELCVEKAIEDAGLKDGTHYLRKHARTDFMFFHPNVVRKKATHRLEVKNVKLRERGARGLAFDGDSLIGFFDDHSEFTETT